MMGGSVLDPKMDTDRELNFFWIYLSQPFNIYLLSSFFVPGTVLCTRFIMVSNVSTAFAQLPKVYKKPCRCHC